MKLSQRKRYFDGCFPTGPKISCSDVISETFQMGGDKLDNVIDLHAQLPRRKSFSVKTVIIFVGKLCFYF